MIINTHTQLVQAVEDGIIPRNQAIAVSYKSRGRLFPPHFSVWSPFFKTNPEDAWYENGEMWFIVDGHLNKKNKEDYCNIAKAWASEKYGITAWLPNRQHDWIPAIVEEIQPIPTPTEEKHESKPRFIR